MSDISAVSDRIWSGLPTQLPSGPSLISGEEMSVDLIKNLPSMWSMYRAILLRRKAKFERDQLIPKIAAETTLKIDTKWVSNYRAVCGLPSAPPESPLPITVPQVFAAPLHTYLLIHPDFPVSALGVVHAANEMIATRPLKAQESMRIRVWVGETRWKPRGVEFDFHTAVFTEGSSEPAWRARTVIFRSVKTSSAKDQSRSTKSPEPLLEGETHSMKLSADLGRRYAPVAGDYNPIHLYPVTARLFGFKRPIVHGMWTLAHVMGRLSHDVSALGQGHYASSHELLSTGSLAVKFRRPLFLPNETKLITDPIGEGWCAHVLDHRGKVAVETAFNPRLDSEISDPKSDVKA